MRKIVFSLLLICSSSVFARANDLPAEVLGTSPLEVNYLFEEQYTVDIKSLPDLVDREEKVSSCMNEYIEKQSKSYAKVVKNNLYDLMNNFGRIASRVYGKKQSTDEIPYEEKIEALARVQCEAYYTMGALK